ncbi:hypothetical protein [Herbidospora cretacea]|uniref:hypothetical protein n=1 Tax=Herbidospora cretacea TaxID=28444 RepID=UPI0004C3B3B9|nr:hypothetical protein [Herbidospora cretacea]
MTAALLGTATAPANAAGGGCRPHSNTAFSFDACQGDDGVLVYGDTYIKRFTGSHCRVTIRVTNGSSQSYPCRIGHLGPQTARMSRGVDYYTSSTISSSAGSLYGISPRSWKP